MHLIKGAEIINLEIHKEQTGELVVIEPIEDIPFKIARVFYVRVFEEFGKRGGHCNSCNELIIVQVGSIFVDVDNGSEQFGTSLEANQALWIQPGVVIRIHALEANTMLLVCASETHASTLRCDNPQPGWQV